MGREVVGHCECPECGFGSAEIKFQKGGLAYRWCPECSAQYFPRNEAASGRLIAKVRKPLPLPAAPVTGTDGGGAKYPPPPPVSAPAPAPKPAKPIETAGTLPERKGTGNALLDLAMGIKS